MNKERKHPILVTGSHRSGSTWVGKILATAPGLRYVHEPFNIDLGYYKSPFSCWYTYISAHSKPELQKAARKYLHSFDEFSTRFYMERMFHIRSLRDVQQLINDLSTYPGTTQTLMKDPIAMLSAEWLYQEMNYHVVLTIRHPAAFVASLKVKEWHHDFNHFLRQTDLMQNELQEHAATIEHYAKNPPDVLQQGILLWNILYSMVSNYQKKYSSQWLFVRHEDLSLDPLKEFKRLFDHLGLEFTSDTRKIIIESTTGSGVSTRETDVFNVKRDSKMNVKAWKDRLTESEIASIKESTHRIWPLFYTEADW